jgi:hypothetical protein
MAPSGAALAGDMTAAEIIVSAMMPMQGDFHMV